MGLVLYSIGSKLKMFSTLLITEFLNYVYLSLIEPISLLAVMYDRKEFTNFEDEKIIVIN